MLPARALLSDKSRLAVLLEHFATIDDPRDVRRISHPLAEILLLVVCGTIADCDDYDHIAAEPRPVWRRLNVSIPDTVRIFRTTNRWPRHGWNGRTTSAEPKGRSG